MTVGDAPNSQLRSVTLGGVGACDAGAAAGGRPPGAQPVHVLLHLWR